jgi:hypothetical protein
MVERRWETLYRSAVLELDRKKLADRIAEAREAIRQRRADGNSGVDPVTPQERQSMEDAMYALAALARTVD